ncbi:MAG: 7TM diverse intracellular signaling domain-containing protein [Leptospiraceae bacterium]
MSRTAIQPHATYSTGEGQPLQKWNERNNFQRLDDNSLGYAEQAHWVHFRVSNPDSESRILYLEYDFSPFDDIKIYRIRKGEDAAQALNKPVAVGGDRYPFYDREIAYRNVIFSLDHEPGSEYDYLIRLETTSSMLVSMYAYSYDEISSRIGGEQIILGLYYGIMLAMVVTSLFLLFSTRDRTYIFYILYILAYVLFQATLNGLTYQYLWPEAITWGNNSLPFFIFLACASILLFCRSFLNSKQNTPRTDGLYWIVLVFSITGMLSALFLFNYRINLIASVVLTLVTLILILANGIHTLMLGVRQARFFLAAWGFFLLGGALNILKSVGVLPDNILTSYGIQVGSALEVMVLSLGMGDRINQLSASLQKNVKALSQARNESEKVSIRLQTLVEEADDFIFTLDEAWNFTMVNKSFQRVLKFNQEELLSMNFLELIYNRDWKDSLNKIFALEKLEELSAPGKSVSFQTEFKQKHVMEPRDSQVRLQYLQYEDGRREILGRASIITEDVLARYLIKERVEFSIENYVRNAEILSQRLSSLISRFADAEVQMTVRTSLREIIINAIEHGNLEITFDEKTKALEEGSYLSLIEERRENPEYKSRKIFLEYSINEDRVAFRVTDEGKGFDHRKMLKTDEKKLNEDFMAHGRGIMMTVSAFDIVRYNEKGNRVALVKYFKKNRS